jgi:hypothetical protein
METMHFISTKLGRTKEVGIMVENLVMIMITRGASLAILMILVVLRLATFFTQTAAAVDQYIERAP